MALAKPTTEKRAERRGWLALLPGTRLEQEDQRSPDLERGAAASRHDGVDSLSALLLFLLKHVHESKPLHTAAWVVSWTQFGK